MIKDPQCELFFAGTCIFIQTNVLKWGKINHDNIFVLPIHSN